MAGEYATYSKWIQEETDLAKNGFSSSKLIIAIKPQGSERLSAVVQEATDKIFGWNSDSIVGGIRELG